MYFTHNETHNSIVAKKFIRALKGKIYKKWQLIKLILVI